MKSISEIYKLPEKSKATERGSLLEYFAEKKGKPIKYIAFRLTGFKIPDLYYLKEEADRYEKGGNPWSKCFWGALKLDKLK